MMICGRGFERRLEKAKLSVFATWHLSGSFWVGNTAVNLSQKYLTWILVSRHFSTSYCNLQGRELMVFLRVNNRLHSSRFIAHYMHHNSFTDKSLSQRCMVIWRGPKQKRSYSLQHLESSLYSDKLAEKSINTLKKKTVFWMQMLHVFGWTSFKRSF